MRDRRGQASVEYMLLLCSMVTVACVTGYFLRDYVDQIVNRLADRILESVLILTFG